MERNPHLVSPVGPSSSEDFALERLVLTTQKDTLLEWLRKWGQKNSLWPLVVGSGCCSVEFMAALGPRYDLARFGSENVRFSPRQSDLMIVGGTVTEKMVPVLKKIYHQMAGPKWVIAMGACASTGGFYRSYNVVQGISREIPVDVYIPGCPPTPEAVIQGLMKIQERIEKGVCSAEGFQAPL